MTDTRLPKEHELAVLKRLSSDDDYRARFAEDPPAALREMGVPDAAISSLDPASLVPGTLADKSVIADTHEKVQSQVLDLHACMIMPLMRMDYGAASGGKSA